MKIWKAFGSAHSANLTIIGEFSEIDTAEDVEKVVEDFVNARWEERYDSPKEFRQAWQDKNEAVNAIHEQDFEIGIDAGCEVERRGTAVEVSGIRAMNITGIIKLMMYNDATEVSITGKAGP